MFVFSYILFAMFLPRVSQYPYFSITIPGLEASFPRGGQGVLVSSSRHPENVDLHEPHPRRGQILGIAESRLRSLLLTSSLTSRHKAMIIYSFWTTERRSLLFQWDKRLGKVPKLKRHQVFHDSFLHASTKSCRSTYHLAKSLPILRSRIVRAGVGYDFTVAGESCFADIL